MLKEKRILPNKMTIVGRAYWAKLSEWVQNMNGDKERSLDVSLDSATVETLKQAGLGGKIKDKGGDRGPFITFTRNEIKKGGAKAGEPNSPIPVLDASGFDLDPSIKIGNGSLVEVTFNIFEVPNFKKPGTHLKPVILGVKILNLVEYSGQGNKDTQVRDTAPRRKVKNTEESWDGDVV